MTWAEFKHAAEEAGVRDNDQICYFEAHADFEGGSLTVTIAPRPPKFDPSDAVSRTWTVFQ